MRSSHHKSRRLIWFERIMALLALSNFALVIFDYTYIPFRNFWLQGKIQTVIKIGSFEQEFPDPPLKVLPFRVTDWYDWVKGIEPYRDTEQYLQLAQNLQQKMNQAKPLDKAKIEDSFQDLRSRSITMIDTNPFQISNKTGTLERIKNKMRKHIFGTTKSSSKEAFNEFWSLAYFEQNNPEKQWQFFDQEIAPLIATNYFRAVGENGEPIDNFILLESPFLIIFFLEFLSRTWLISRHHKSEGITWFDAMLWRWYDVFLWLPLFHLLRIIPVTIRLNKAQLIDLSRIRKQVKQGFVADIAQEMTEVVMITTINQIQTMIREGEIRNIINQNKIQEEYIDINDINETAEILRLVIQTFVNRVFPKIQPEFQSLLNYNLKTIIHQIPLYKNLPKPPEIVRLENQLISEISGKTHQVFAEVMQNMIQKDPEFENLLDKLIQSISKTMSSELKAQQSVEKIEFLLNDLLEEIKINYVQRLAQEDIEAILEQTRKLKLEAKDQARVSDLRNK